MSPILISLGLALTAGLLMPGAASALSSWASALHRSSLHILEQSLPDSFVFIEHRRYAVWLMVLVVGCALLATWLSGSGLVGFVAGVLSLCVPALVARRVQRRRRQQLIAQLPDALDLLASSLRSGLALAPALAHLADHQPPPLSQELALLVRQQRLGRSLDESLAHLCARIGGAELALFATAVAVARVVGGSLSEILSRLAHTLRERHAIEDKLAALTAQARLQARIAGLLPLALLLVMTRLEPRAMHLMFTTDQGRASLLVLAVLELVGALWLRRQARIDV